MASYDMLLDTLLLPLGDPFVIQRAATLGRWCRDTGEMVDASDAAAPVEPWARHGIYGFNRFNQRVLLRFDVIWPKFYSHLWISHEHHGHHRMGKQLAGNGGATRFRLDASYSRANEPTIRIM